MSRSTASHVSEPLFRLALPLLRGLIGLYFGKIQVEGQQHIPEQGPCVLAAKHFSRWDPLIIGQISDAPLRYMTNANQFSGIQGWFIQRLGAYPVSLAKPSSTSLRYTIELLQQGQKLVIFPEGGIVRDQLLRRLKPGVARLVLSAEQSVSPPISIPIIPIAVHYEPAAQPGATVTLLIGPPLSSQELLVSEPHLTDKEKAMQITDALDTALRGQLAQLHERSQHPPFQSVESGKTLP